MSLEFWSGVYFYTLYKKGRVVDEGRIYSCGLSDNEDLVSAVADRIIKAGFSYWFLEGVEEELFDIFGIWDNNYNE